MPDLFTILLAAIAVTQAADSVVPRPLAPEAVFAMRTPRFGAHVTVSADGRYAAYVAVDPKLAVPDSDHLTTPSGWRFLRTGAPQDVGQVWVVDLQTEREMAVAGTTASSWSPVWSPTGSELALLSDRDGHAGLWIWRADSATLRRVGSAPVSSAYYGTLHWTSDGRRIVVASPPLADLEWSPGRVAAVSSPVAPDSPYVEIRQAGLAPSTASAAVASTGLPDLPYELVSIDVATGARTVLVHDQHIDWCAPSPDGRWVVYTTMRAYSLPEGQRYQPYYDIFVVPLGGGTPRRLAADVPLLTFGADVMRWAPDSKHLLYGTSGFAVQRGLSQLSIAEPASAPERLTPFVATPDSAESYSQGAIWDSAGKSVYGWSGSHIWRYDATTGRGREVAQFPGWTVLTVLEARRSLLVMASSDSGVTSGFYRVDPHSGAVSKLYQVQKRLGGVGMAEAQITTTLAAHGSQVIFWVESASEPSELWAADIAFQHARPLSHMGGNGLNVPLGERRIIEWTSPSGLKRRGILVLPADYRPGTRYPLIVWMYEKILPAYTNTFGIAGQAFFNFHLFATRGYAAFYPSLVWTKDSVLPSLGEQVHDGVRELARRGIVDSTRVGIVGQSSGGYDVLAVATAYPGVRAGVAVSGISDMMMEFGGDMDDPVGYEWAERQMGLGAPPWEHPERYVLNSPSFHFDRAGASLLLLEGTGDDFAVHHMDLAYSILKRLGKPVEYRRYPGEGHVPDEWREANRLDAERAMLGWFDKYVKGHMQ